MGDGETVLLATGLPGELWQLVRPRLGLSLANLELASEFGAITLCADDLPGDDDSWYHLLPGSPDAPGAHLVLTHHPDVFCARRPRTSTSSPPRAIWEQMAAPRSDRIGDGFSYSEPRTDVFLHHHLLTVKDMRLGELDGEYLPARLAEAFCAAWAVAVDGRLQRRHLPGYSVAERRGRFSRLFSAAGILMPEHWQIFESLWGGGLVGQKAILGAVRQLPQL